MALQLLSTIEFAQIAIKGSEGSVASLARNFEHQAVRETDRRPPTEALDGCSNRVSVLNGQILVIQEHIDSCRNRLRAAIVDRCEHPGRFSERQVRDPGSIDHEGLGGGHLLCVIPCDEPDEHVSVNGSHGVS